MAPQVNSLSKAFTTIIDLPYRDMQLIINYQSISRVQPKVYRWCSSRVTDKQCQWTSLLSRY